MKPVFIGLVFAKLPFIERRKGFSNGIALAPVSLIYVGFNLIGN